MFLVGSVMLVRVSHSGMLWIMWPYSPTDQFDLVVSKQAKIPSDIRCEENPRSFKKIDFRADLEAGQNKATDESSTVRRRLVVKT